MSDGEYFHQNWKDKRFFSPTHKILIKYWKEDHKRYRETITFLSPALDFCYVATQRCYIEFDQYVRGGRRGWGGEGGNCYCRCELCIGDKELCFWQQWNDFENKF